MHRTTRNSTTGRSSDSDEAEVDVRNDSVDSQRDDADQLKTRIAQLEAEVTELQQMRIDLTSQLGTSGAEVTKLEQERHKLSSMNDDLKSENDALTKDLEHAKELLEDEKALAADLLNRLDVAPVLDDKTALLITDRNDDGLFTMLRNRLGECKLETRVVDSISDLANMLTNSTPGIDLKNYVCDKIMLLMGTNEILADEDGQMVASKLFRTAKLILDKLDVPVCLFQLPPMTDTKRLTSIALFNSRLQRLGLDVDQPVEVVTTKDRFSSHLKSQLLTGDGLTMSPLAHKVFCDAVIEQVKIEKLERKPPMSTSGLPDEEIQEALMIPEDCVGSIIGNKGATVRSIQNNSGAQISVINFKRKENTYYAALISGNQASRSAAKREINNLTKKNSGAEGAPSAKRRATYDPLRPTKLNK